MLTKSYFKIVVLYRVLPFMLRAVHVAYLIQFSRLGSRSLTMAVPAFVLQLMIVGPVFAEEKTPVAPKLKFQLDQSVRWGISEEPLIQVLEMLTKLHQIEFSIDKKSMQQHGISDGRVINSTGKGTLAEMLTTILEPIDLEWVAVGNKVAVRVQNMKRRKVQEATASISLRKKLSSIYRYDFAGRPLEDVLQELRRTHQVQIFIDGVSLEAAKISTEVTIRGTGLTTLRNALDDLLKPSQLTWVAKGDRILVQAAKEQSE